MNHKKQVIAALLVMCLCLFGLLPSIKKEQQAFAVNQILQEATLNPDVGDPDEGWSFLRNKLVTTKVDTPQIRSYYKKKMSLGNTPPISEVSQHFKIRSFYPKKRFSSAERRVCRIRS